MAPVGFPPFFRNFPLDERTRGGAESEGGDEPHPRIKFVWPYRHVMFDLNSYVSAHSPAVF